jgi:hypothetical protein
MFAKTAKSRDVDRRHRVSAVLAAGFASDNQIDRRGWRAGHAGLAGRLSCRWQASPATGNLECHWEIENADATAKAPALSWPIREARWPVGICQLNRRAVRMAMC